MLKTASKHLEGWRSGADVSSVSLASIGGVGFYIHWHAHMLPLLLLPYTDEKKKFVIDRFGGSWASWK